MPRYWKTSVQVPGTFSFQLPSRSVVVPDLVPLICTNTPISVSPPVSRTQPCTVKPLDWACRAQDSRSAAQAAIMIFRILICQVA